MFKIPDILKIKFRPHKNRGIISYFLGKLKNEKLLNISFVISSLAMIIFIFFLYQKYQRSITQMQLIEIQKSEMKQKLNTTNKNLNDLQNEDQFLKNKKLEEEINNIQETYKKSVAVYEHLVDLRNKTKVTASLDAAFAESLSLLRERNYASAEAILSTLDKDIITETDKFNASFKIPENISLQSTPPSSGYRRQKIEIDGGILMVDIISAEIGTTKVIVDTASNSDCGNDCPTLPLSDYVARNGAYAGVNGSYFCPATYPTCAGKTNSFDLLLMNKNKTYFNSSNNIYSNNPAVIFGGSYVRFVRAVSEWGRDTSIDGMISNFPLLVFNSEIVYGGDSDPKHLNKGGRSFVAQKGSNIYIGVVYNATVLESAKVMKALGLENAINLDDGGSTAFWFGGYKAGPGRNIPNAILFIKK